VNINRPGIYPDIDPAAYYADPCATPSLTQSLAKILLERSPLHAWHAHPRLNPDYRERDGREAHLDLGTIAHAMLLGRSKTIVVLDYDDWRTKAAQEARKNAAASGDLAVLAKHHAKAKRMVDAAREQLELRNLGWLFGELNGDAECCLAWKEDGIWLRQLVDWVNAARTIVADYKTTGESAAPEALPRKAVDWGWHIQAAMAERGLDNLGLSVGRREYLWVVQESTEPYQLTICSLGEAYLTLGRWQLNNAIEIWKRCMEANHFPGYPLRVESPELPPWHAGQMFEQQIERDNGIPSDILAAG